jgi:hypothetical protein
LGEKEKTPLGRILVVRRFCCQWSFGGAILMFSDPEEVWQSAEIRNYANAENVIGVEREIKCLYPFELCSAMFGLYQAPRKTGDEA